MSAKDSAALVAKSALTRAIALLETALANLAGFLLPMVAMSGCVIGVRGIAEWLIEHGTPWLALGFVALAGAVWAIVLSFVRPEHLRNPAGRILPGPALGFLFAAAAVWVYVFATFSYIVFRLGLVEYTFRGSPDNALPDLSDAYLWYLFDLIPALKINAALGWPPDVDLNGGWRGTILLLFRIVIVFQLFALGRALLNDDKKRAVDAQPTARRT